MIVWVTFHFPSTGALLIFTFPHFPSLISTQIRGKWKTGRKKILKKKVWKKALRFLFYLRSKKISIKNITGCSTKVEGWMNRNFCLIPNILDWLFLFEGKWLKKIQIAFRYCHLCHVILKLFFIICWKVFILWCVTFSLLFSFFFFFPFWFLMYVEFQHSQRNIVNISQN